MKFQTEEQKAVLARLLQSGDFRYYVGMLSSEYEKAVADLLFSSPQDAEVKRGAARQLYTQLKELGMTRK